MTQPSPKDVLLAQRELWKLGVLSWKLRPEQRKLKDALEQADTELAVFNISRRWGKTYTLVTYALEQAIRRRQKIRFGCAFLTDLEEFILPAFELILEDCPEHIRPVYLKTKKTWVFPANGSEIKLVGLDKSPNSLRGNGISKIIIDEAGFVANLKKIYTSVIIPATAKQKDIKLVFLSTPPESPEHYFVELIQKAQVQANGHYVCLTIDDISDLDPAEKKRLLDEVGGEQSPEAQREFFCKIKIDASRAVAPSFDAARHVREFEEESVLWTVFGDAGGVRDLWAFLKVGWSHALQKVLFADELTFKPNTPSSEIVEAVKEKFPNLSVVLDRHPQTGVDFSALGLPTASPMKDEFGAGIGLLNTAFHNDQALVHPRCKLFLRTLEGGLLNRARTDYERTKELGHCDYAASAIYALRGVDKLTDLRPRPNPEDVFVRKTEPTHVTNLKNLSWST